MPQHFTFETGPREPDNIRAELKELAADTRVGEHLGNVWWAPRGTDYYSPWNSVTLPDEIVAPQVVTATVDDDYWKGRAQIYRRFDGEYVPVGAIVTPDHNSSLVVDYVAANYGTVPRLPHRSGRRQRVFDEERPIPGSHELPPSEPETNRQETLFAVLRENRADLSLAEVAPLLEIEEFYHLLATKLPDAVSDESIDRRVLDWLDSDDQTERARAVRWIGAVESTPYTKATDPRDGMKHTPDSVPSVEGIDTFARFIQAIPTVDATTQRLVAPALWEPWILGADEPPEPGQIRRLTGLLEADLPEIRVGALQGSSRLLGEAVYRERTDDAVEPDEPLTLFIEAFCEGYVTALSDDHPAVRFRAAGLSTSCLAGGMTDAIMLPVLKDLMSDETLWEIGRRSAQLHEDPHEAIQPGNLVVEEYFKGVSVQGLDSIETLVSYGYEHQGPKWRKAREALAERAEDDPALLAEHVDAPLAALRDGSVTPADLSLLQTLVSDRPDMVASASDELAALLDDAYELRTEAAWTLLLLRWERPDAVPVERERLIEVLSEVCDEDGEFGEPERLRRLAVADPEQASETLARLADVVTGDGEKDKYSVTPLRLGKTIQLAAQVNPEVVASAADAVCAAVPEFSEHKFEAFAGLARATVAHPEAFVDHVDILVDKLGQLRLRGSGHVNFESLATALVAIGQHDEQALPPSVRPILDRADDVYDPDELDELVERVRHKDPPEVRDNHPTETLDDDLLADDW